MKLVDLHEGLSKKAAEDAFLFGHCASFAVALQRHFGGDIYSLKRNGKHMHVFVKREGKTYDVMGARSTGAMAMSLVGGVEGWQIEGPFEHPDIPTQKPKQVWIDKALAYIEQNQRLFK